jgi:RHS repeat-associated protein
MIDSRQIRRRASGRTVAYNLRFPGQIFDGQAGLHYNHFRDYDPATGRYLESDPLGVAISVNTYAYVDADPIDYADPSGLAKCTYSILQHTMTCTSNDGSSKAVVGPQGLWSGLRQCENNPSSACTASANFGPVPPGKYNMNKDDRPEHAGRNFWRLEPVPKIPGWKCGFPFIGARCGFEFHPGSVSLGCITADKTNPDLMKQYAQANDLLLQEVGSNTLTVVP